MRLAIIDGRVLTLDLLRRGLQSIGDCEIITTRSVEEWLERRQDLAVTLIVLCLQSARSAGDAHKKLAMLSQAMEGVPIVVMGDANDDAHLVARILELGARGYIATDLPLDVAFQAMCLVSAGGIYVPASCLLNSRAHQRGASKADPTSQLFTARQTAVVDALRRGKANKTIAFELNMRESTVKVHVRNIMKKLKAKNRTEVAYMTNASFDDLQQV